MTTDGEYFYITISDWPAEDDKRSIDTVYQYSLDGKKIKPVFSYPDFLGYLAVYGRQLIATDYHGSKLFSVDLDTGSFVEIETDGFSSLAADDDPTPILTAYSN